MWDVAIVGGGPGGASCAAHCARAGLRTLVFERENFPREKVCGDCLNPGAWPILERLGVAAEVRDAPHARLSRVDFIDLDGRTISAPLPAGEEAEISIRRSVLDEILLRRARSLGAEVREGETVFGLESDGAWTIRTNSSEARARIVVAADGRNSTIARLCHLMRRKTPDRVAWQTHIPLPPGFGDRIVLQLLPQGYSGQAPVGNGLLNLCLVSRPNDRATIRCWAEREFQIAPDHPWRTIAPLARAALPPHRAGLFLVGDAARVVEPFTGEGIYYALRSGELAAEAIAAGEPERYVTAHRRLYRGRLWLNHLARFAVENPFVTGQILSLLPYRERLLAALTAKVVPSSSGAQSRDPVEFP